jgi:DNA-nicking Smr family endonuclease
MRSSETLDGRWDRWIASGRVQPDRTIDLHGLSLEAARHHLFDAVAAADARGERVLLVITGKGHLPGPAPADLMPGLNNPDQRPRGAIRVSLPRWVGEAGLSARVAAVRRAHPRHGGAGAVYLILKRRRG